MTNRINGDFEQDAIEAFRAAYAAQLSNPEDHEIDPINGLPTNVVHNTSPWIEHTGLWKANDGMSRDFKPNQPFNPDDYFPANSESEGDDGNDDEVAEDTDTDAVYLTDEEFERLSEEIWGPGDGDSDGGAESDSDDNETQYEEDPYEESENEEGEELNEDEIDTLIDEILSERLEDDEDEDSDSEVGGEYENEDDEDGEYNDEE